MATVETEPAAGWLPLKDAAARAGVCYETLRQVARRGDVFSRRELLPGRKRPRVFIREDELAAWVAGGVDAVKAAVRDRRRAGRKP